MIDLHLHTTASDGTLVPSDLIDRAADAGLTIVSVTDHDTTAGLYDGARAAHTRGLRFIDGIEITAVEDGRDVHVLGYFIDTRSETLRSFLKRQSDDRIRRVRAMGDRLRALGYAIDVDAMVRSSRVAAGRTLGRPQLADALVKSGHATDRGDAFDRLLGRGRPAFVSRTGAPVAQVIQVIRDAGGIASLAHPGLLDMDDAIGRFAAAGLAALEVRHSDHDRTAEHRYRSLARALGLAVSGGSDFHGDGSHHRAALGAITLSQSDFQALEARAGFGGSIRKQRERP